MHQTSCISDRHTLLGVEGRFAHFLSDMWTSRRSIPGLQLLTGFLCLHSHIRPCQFPTENATADPEKFLDRDSWLSISLTERKRRQSYLKKKKKKRPKAGFVITGTSSRNTLRDNGLSVTESETYRFGSHLIHKMLEWL